MNDRKLVKLNDVLKKAHTGADAITRAPIVDYDSGIRCLRTSDISNDKDFSLWGFCSISDENYDRFRLCSGDILIARTGPIGKPFFIPSNLKAVFNNGIMRIVVDQSKVYPKYLYYYLQNDDYRRYVQSVGAASASRPNIKMDVVLNYTISLPPLPGQHKIAAMLSAYDDLIENNTRRIQILEEMAQAIYRQWFVEFKFPLHEDVPRIDSGTELGEIPEGWEVQPFSNLVIINPKLAVDKRVKKPYVGMNALSMDSMLIDLGLVEMKTGSSGAKFQNRDVLFPRITPSVENGKAGFVQFLDEGQIAIGSTEIIVFREKELNPEYIYFLSREPDFRGNAINSMVGASGRQRVQLGCFDAYLVAKPPRRLLEQFAETVTPMFEIAHTLTRKNANLRATRDLLLPRLVSGEVDVSALKIQ
jgi:type I restriction enzyme S subunit